MSERDEVGAAATLAPPAAADPSLDATLAPTAAGAETAPTTRGNYVVIRELARGAMGRIMVARDLRLGREVALKELLVSDADLALRFEREARITARLSHPGIVSVHEAGKWPSGEPYYVMRLVAGRPLDRVIADAHTAQQRLALLPHVIAVADALAYAHAQRIIHRDLKPGNVLIGAFGDTVVIDWGLARDLGERESRPSGTAGRGTRPGETVAGDVMGTPAYMPPEQARGEEVDARADVYALGSLLHHVLAGRTPYQASSVHDALDQLIQGPPRPLTEVAPEAPPDLATVVGKAMARDPKDRYADAGELAADLKRFQTGQLVGAHRYSAGQLIRRFLARHRAATTAALVALVAVAAIATYSVRRIIRARDAERAQRERAEKSQREAELRADEALLAQADGALASDPTQAVKLVQKLRLASPRWAAARMIAADAVARGVAQQLWRPDGGRLFALALSSDGKQLAATGIDDSLWLWPVTGAPVEHDAPETGYGLSFSNDGRFIFSGMRTWDIAGQTWSALPGLPPGCDQNVFPVGALREVAPATGQVAWQVAGNCLPVVARDGEPPKPVAAEPARELRFSSDGKLLAVRGPTEVVVLDDTGAVKLRHAVSGDVSAMAFDRSGAWLAMVGRQTSELVELAAPDARHQLPTSGDQVVGTAAGRFYAIEANGRGVAVLDPDRVRGVIAIRGGMLARLVLSPDGRWLATGADDGTITVLDLETQTDSVYGYVADSYQLRGHSDLITGLVFAPDGKTLYSSSYDGTVREWPAPAVRRFPIDGQLAPDASVLVTLESAGTLSVHDVQSNQDREFQLPAKGDGWDSFSIEALAPGGAHALVSNGMDYRVIALSDGHQLFAPEIASGPGKRFLDEELFSPDASWLLIGRVGPVHRFRLPDGHEVPLPGSSELTRRLAFAGDDVVAIDGAAVLRWGPGGGPAHALDQPPARPELLAVAPDGCCVAVAGADEVVIWDLASGKRRVVQAQATALAFAPTRALAIAGNRTLVVISPDGRRSDLPGTTQGAFQLAWDRDGRRVLGRWKEELWMWDIEAGRARADIRHGIFTPTQILAWKDGWLLSNGRELRRFTDDLPREPVALLARLADLTR